jgi:hypothetical protein
MPKRAESKKRVDALIRRAIAVLHVTRNLLKRDALHRVS